MAEPARAAHFPTLEAQRHAARFGMWLFITTELLLFSALFATYAYHRTLYPEAFSEGIRHAEKLAGSLNTALLLVSSYLVARSLPAAEADRGKGAAALLAGAVGLGLVFLGVKAYEYSHHIAAGALPGGWDRASPEAQARALPIFYDLYYVMTGVHALHVIIGLVVLSVFARLLYQSPSPSQQGHRLEIAALYWHLVDLVWLFLWPLFYLTPGGAT
jgi:cytochrome c oxidase subunit 3